MRIAGDIVHEVEVGWLFPPAVLHANADGVHDLGPSKFAHKASTCSEWWMWSNKKSVKIVTGMTIISLHFHLSACAILLLPRNTEMGTGQQNDRITLLFPSK
jgi:hypothetical protein